MLAPGKHLPSLPPHPYTGVEHPLSGQIQIEIGVGVGIRMPEPISAPKHSRIGKFPLLIPDGIKQHDPTVAAATTGDVVIGMGYSGTIAAKKALLHQHVGYISEVDVVTRWSKSK